MFHANAEHTGIFDDRGIAPTNSELWWFKTGGAVSSSPAVSNDISYFGSYNNKLYVMDAVTGKEKWRFETGNYVKSSPAVSNGVVYVGSRDGYLYAIGGVPKSQINTQTSPSIQTVATNQTAATTVATTGA